MNAEIRAKSEYRSSLRSKALIRKALLDLLEEKSFDKITITDVAKRADVNRGTFYLHYKDVSEVLKHIALSFVDELFDKIEELDIERVIENPELVFSIISEFLSKDFEFYQKLIELDTVGFVLNEALERGKGYFLPYIKSRKELYVKQPEIVVNYILAGTISVYCDILRGKIDVTLEESPSYLGHLARSLVAAHINTSLTATVAE